MSNSIITGPTHTVEADGITEATRVAASLITWAVEFHVEPLPDDVWEFTVKLEDRTFLDGILDSIRREVAASTRSRREAWPVPRDDGYLQRDLSEDRDLPIDYASGGGY